MSNAFVHSPVASTSVAALHEECLERICIALLGLPTVHTLMTQMVASNVIHSLSSLA